MNSDPPFSFQDEETNPEITLVTESGPKSVRYYAWVEREDGVEEQIECYWTE